MISFPVARLLTPATRIAPPEGFSVVDDPILRGLPHFIPLSGELRLVVLVPTGLIRHWMDADPLLVVSRSDAELQPKSAGETEEFGSAALPAARLVLQQGATSIGSTDLTAGRVITLPETGSPVRIHLYVSAWDLRAGSLRGPGNFGSRITVAWRAADLPSAHFSTPPVNPVLTKRLPPQFRVESRLGLYTSIKLRRFDTKRLLIR